MPYPVPPLVPSMEGSAREGGRVALRCPQVGRLGVPITYPSNPTAECVVLKR